MELRHLRYFVAVAEELNFRRAAERLMMAQPPLSQQIHRLEAELGVSLFDRAHRRVQLTAAGRVFLEDARAILMHAEESIVRARQASVGELGRLTVGYTSLIHCPLFPGVLRRYRERYPGVELVLRDLVTIEQMRRLSTNTLDISFATHATLAFAAVDGEQLARECVFREPLVAAVPRDHPLTTRTSVPLTTLADEPWVWFARQYDPTTYDYMTRLFAQAGFRPRVVQEVNQAQIFIDLVAAGLGVSLVTASVRQIATDAVAYLDIEPPSPFAEFDLVWRRDDNSPLLRAFLEAVRDTANAAT